MRGVSMTKTTKMQDGTFIMTEAGLESLMKISGYWVAYEETTLDKLTTGDIVGVWTDNLTGKVWIDKSMHIEDLTMAMSFGKLYKQEAIYDIANNREVRIAA